HARVRLAAAHVVIQQPLVEVGRRVQRSGRRIQRHGKSRAASAAELAACPRILLSRKWRNLVRHASILEGSASDWPQEGGEERMSKRTQTHGTLSLRSDSRFGQKETDREASSRPRGNLAASSRYRQQLFPS